VQCTYITLPKFRILKSGTALLHLYSCTSCTIHIPRPRKLSSVSNKNEWRSLVRNSQWIYYMTRKSGVEHCRKILKKYTLISINRNKMLKIMNTTATIRILTFFIQYLNADNMQKICKLVTPSCQISLLSMNDDILELILHFLERESKLNFLYAVSTTVCKIPRFLHTIANDEFPVQCIYKTLMAMARISLYFLPQECTYQQGTCIFICADWSVFSPQTPGILAIVYWSEETPHSSVNINDSELYTAYSESKHANRGQMRLSAHCMVNSSTNVNHYTPIGICPTNIEVVNLTAFSKMDR